MILGQVGDGYERLDADQGGISSQLVGKLILDGGFDRAGGLPFLEDLEADPVQGESPQIKEPSLNHFRLLDSILVIYLGELLLEIGHPRHPCVQKSFNASTFMRCYSSYSMKSTSSQIQTRGSKTEGRDQLPGAKVTSRMVPTPPSPWTTSTLWNRCLRLRTSFPMARVPKMRQASEAGTWTSISCDSSPNIYLSLSQPESPFPYQLQQTGRKDQISGERKMEADSLLKDHCGMER